MKPKYCKINNTWEIFLTFTEKELELGYKALCKLMVKRLKEQLDLIERGENG
jgi:hypothetical protein